MLHNIPQHIIIIIIIIIPRYNWIFGLCSSFGILKNTTFQKMNLFPFSGEGFEAPALLGPLEGANLCHWTAYVNNKGKVVFVII
jgi:hypothetical protein